MRAANSTCTAVCVLAIVGAFPALGDTNPCSWSRDLKLIHGKIHTMDGRDSVISEVVIRDGHFAAVGEVSNRVTGPCTRVIDLHGRTVVPGLIDNHNHFILPAGGCAPAGMTFAWRPPFRLRRFSTE